MLGDIADAISVYYFVQQAQTLKIKVFTVIIKLSKNQVLHIKALKRCVTTVDYMSK